MGPRVFLNTLNIQRAPLYSNYRRNFLLLQQCSQQIGSIFSGEGGGMVFPFKITSTMKRGVLKAALAKFSTLG